jgi:hypothetical protein
MELEQFCGQLALEKPLLPKRLERSLPVLTHRGPGPLVRLAARLSETDLARKAVQEPLGALRKRLALMPSPTFRGAGWPIGSGMVERANQLVVEARLKGTGMRWERTNGNPMLALRHAVCQERWQETWQTASLQRRDLLVQRRHQRSAPRPEAVPQALKHAPLDPPPPQPPRAPLLPPDPPAMLAGTSRPSSHHRLPTWSCLCHKPLCNILSRTQKREDLPKSHSRQEIRCEATRGNST